MPAYSNLASPAEWPAHWRRPSPEDLVIQQAGYARGFVPPHAAILNEAMPPLEVGSVASDDAVAALYEVAEREKQAANGRAIVGLAAPQIGIRGRAILFDPRADVPMGQAAPELLCVINPTIRAVGHVLIESPEGCLSTGQFRALVQRWGHVELSGVTQQGDELVNVPYHGLAARVLQHEIWGHLRGRRSPDIVPDERLLWVPTAELRQYYEHMGQVIRGEAKLQWRLAPRGQWEALKAGVPIFGEPEGI